MYFHSSWQMPKCETSMKVDCSNAMSTCHLLPTSFGFRDFERTTNSRSSSLMIPRTLKCQNAKMGSTSHGMRDRWPFGIFAKLDPSFDFHRTYPLTDTWDPPFGVSLFAISGVVLTMQLHFLSPETPKSDWYPTAIVPQPFREFFLSLFRISRTGSLKLSIPKSLPPLLPEPRKAEMPKFHSKDTSRFMTSGFSMQRAPDSLSSEFPKCRTPKCQNSTPDNPFRDSGI
jgi:hypothetical protein